MHSADNLDTCDETYGVLKVTMPKHADVHPTISTLSTDAALSAGELSLGLLSLIVVNEAAVQGLSRRTQATGAG